VRVLDLVAGSERAVAAAELLADPARHFEVFGGGGHA
jgi:hypothetical protein